MSLSSLVDKPLMQNPLAGGSLPTTLKQADPNNLIAGYTPPTGGGLESSFDSGGFKPLSGTSFDLLELSNRDSNNERQYFYNKDLNRLFNMPMGVRMAAPKGFESVNKNQYEDYGNKGATLQGASMFTDAMGGGYNLDLPRLTSGPNSGGLDRNSPEFLYYYGDQQQPKLPPKLSLGPTMPTQEEGIPGASGSNIPLNNFPGNPNRKPADPANLPEFGRPPSMFSNTEGIGSLIGFEPIDQTFNGRQTFNNEQAFNEYVDSLVNERLKDFFGGIMGAIDV